MKVLGKPTRIANPHLLSFSLKESGWYLVSVSARVRAKDQKGEKATDDEDLRVEIDERKFPKPEDPQRYFDSPAAFSGAKLRNSLKTVFFVMYLNADKHSLSLIPDEEAVVENVEVTPLADFPTVSLELNQQAEKANSRPLMTFVLVDLGLKSFTAKVTVNWRFPDGDNVKIIVNGKIEKNNLSILHRNWIFASNMLRKFFGQETVEKKFTENLLKEDLHCLEFWSDESPIVHYVKFELEPLEIKSKIQIYKNGPKEEDYNRFDEEIKSAVDDWNDFSLKQEYPPPDLLDPNIVKAMVYIETRIGYGVSSAGYPAYPDVIQVADERNPAIHTLNNDGWIDPKTRKIAREYEWTNDKEEVLDYDDRANGNTPGESIYWGVRWLYHKAQGTLKGGGRYWKSWKEAVADYNRKGNWEYQKKVWKIYKEGIDPQGLKLWSILIVFLLSFSLLGGVLLYLHQGKFYVYREPVNGTSDFQFYIKTLNGLRLEKFVFSRFYANGANLSAFYKNKIELRYLWPKSKQGKAIAVLGRNIADFETATVIFYKNGNFKILPKLNKYGGLENTFHADEIIIKNLDEDSEEEVIESTPIGYINAPDQIWQSYFDLDKSTGVYKFKKQEKILVSRSL